ncbi:MAG: Asp-tRNA(Asn)/Glu-tRNA(Gln) amidotransferase subunit GatB [Candidatus Poribacteria bacterium]|nr:Asp-tRNA(Asn)/Glu-tRNA(Gln) amidotransferase subunit GatB [Candidatus Poribacteria bacterium]
MADKKYETVIGLEIHAEFSTHSKLFCTCEVKFGSDANTQTCPICLGMPGVLPVMNKRALEFAIRAGLAMNCKIASYSKFDRKNYFYPDLPKGYQISQYDLPLACDGYVDFEFEDEIKRVRIHRVHLEEDAGKLVHADVTGDPNRSYVDFNRSCVPLLEIVSEPNLRSPAAAIAYWRAVKEILEYIDVSDCNMEEGSFRCDANISLRPVGSEEFGTRTELKNKNSFQHVLAALQYEEKRQARILDEGGTVEQVTLLYDLNTGRTSPMRSKEEAHDYRYFPEPDLAPFEVDPEEVERLRSTLPELPAERRKRFVEEYGIPAYDAGFLTTTRQMADFFDETARLSGDPKASSNWIMGDVSALLNSAGIGIQDAKVTAAHLSELIQLIKGGTISGKIAKSVIADVFETGKFPKQIVEEKGLAQISDTSAIEAVVDQVIAAHSGPAQDYRDGKKKALGFLVGQVMRATRGKANPQMVNQLLRRKLDG